MEKCYVIEVDDQITKHDMNKVWSLKTLK